MKLIDLTHTFTSSMPVYPGDPQPSLTQVATLEKEGYNDHQITTVMHVGTHIDAPLHMIAHGKRMDEIPPETFIGKGVLIDARGARLIDANLLEGLTIEPGSIVLIYTGFGAKYRDRSYFENFPTITEEFAKRVVESKVKIVGMDLPGPDQPPFPIHKALLGNGILIIENLTNLDKLLGVTNFEVIALPAKLHADAAPARVISRIM